MRRTGFSGGPVLNKNGEVVALLIEGTQNFMFAISTEDIIKFLKENKIK